MDKSLEDTFRGQLEANYFPISLDDISAKLNFVDLTESEVNIEDINITSVYLSHPGMTLGYKIKYKDKTVVYASDNEIQSIDHDENTAQYGDYMKFVDFIRDVDILIADAQYSDEEYEKKKGWGHSPLSYIIKTAVTANVKKIVLFHHDPMHTDEIIDGMVKDAERIIEENNGTTAVSAAKENEEIKL